MEGLTMNRYQELAQRTAAPNSSMQTRLMIAALGLAGEAGEIADTVKKWVGHGHAFHTEDVKKELGDILWYIAEAAAALGYTLDDVAVTNVVKLRKRYPEGFSSEASINRVE